MTAQGPLQRRTRGVRAVVALVALAFVLRLVDIQVLGHAAYAKDSRQELLQHVAVPAVRGGIYDRNGSILATTVVLKTVVGDPLLISQAHEQPAQLAAQLAPILGASVSELTTQLTGSGQYVVLARRLPAQVSAQVSAWVAKDRIDGINLVDESQRILPDGTLAEPVIGMVGADGNGQSGLEYQYNGMLAGRAGVSRYLAGPLGVPLGSASSGSTSPVPGVGLELTIDQSVQYVAERALASEIVAAHAASGVAVVMNTRTGDIVAMANLQAVANAASGAAGGTVAATPPATPPAPTAQQPAVLASPSGILPAGVEEAPSNSAVTQVYEPGSVFKLVTFSAALAHGVITPDTQIQVPASLPMGKYTFHDAEAHGNEVMTASQIIAQSSNIGTIKIAQALGRDRLLQQIATLGFGEPTGLGFPGESQGLIPPVSAWTGTSIGSTPIGQDDAVTAQQLLDAYNAVADGGIFVAPRLIRATVTPDGAVHAAPASPTHRVIDPATNAALVGMLEGVVRSGTGVEAALDGYTVAGKTGTAQIPDPNHLGYIPGAYIGTFAGFAPAQDPVLSAVVVLDHPTPIYGGAVAAPVFATIMQYALRHFGVPTTVAGTPTTAPGAVGSTGSIKVNAGVVTEGP